jgi:hypothetical protein
MLAYMVILFEMISFQNEASLIVTLPHNPDRQSRKEFTCLRKDGGM